MSKKIIKKGPSNGGSATGVIGHIGDNCVVKDVPCLLPKENMDMFNKMQKASSQCSFGSYPNPFNAFWKGQK